MTAKRTTTTTTRTRLAALTTAACIALLPACTSQDDTGQPAADGATEPPTTTPGTADADTDPGEGSGSGFDTDRLCDLLTEAEIEAELGEYGPAGEGTLQQPFEDWIECNWPMEGPGYYVAVAFIDDLDQYPEPYEESFARRRDALPDQGLGEAVVLSGIGDEAYLRQVSGLSIYARSGPIVIAVLFELPVAEPPLAEMSALASLAASRL